MITILTHALMLALGVGIAMVMDWGVSTISQRLRIKELEDRMYKAIKEYGDITAGYRTIIGDLNTEKRALRKDVKRLTAQLKGSETRFKKFTKGEK